VYDSPYLETAKKEVGSGDKPKKGMQRGEKRERANRGNWTLSDVNLEDSYNNAPCHQWE